MKASSTAPFRPRSGPASTRRCTATATAPASTGTRRPDVPVLKGHAGAAAFAQGPGAVDPGMAAPTRGAGLRPGRGEPASAPHRGLAHLAGPPAQHLGLTPRRAGLLARGQGSAGRLPHASRCTGQCPIKVDAPTFRSKFFELYYGAICARRGLCGRLDRVPRAVDGAHARACPMRLRTARAGESCGRSARAHAHALGLEHRPCDHGARSRDCDSRCIGRAG